MNAAYITGTGDRDVIEFGDLSDPEPGPVQVLIRVEAVADKEHWQGKLY